MKIGIINFTFNGGIINERLKCELDKRGYNCNSYTTDRLLDKFDFKPINGSLEDWTYNMFLEKDAIIFIGAVGIAVRLISKYIVSKDKDPAIIVIDEGGQFIIPILSGHIGGANKLAIEISTLIGGSPVITTATDINRKFAVDSFAVNNNLYISDIKKIKLISSAILEGKMVGFTSDYDILGIIPRELDLNNKLNIGINISIKDNNIKENILNLIPKSVTIGIGCRRDTEPTAIENHILKILRDNNISIHSIKKVASIDLKKNERGIIEFCKKYKIPFETYKAEELNSLEGDFTASAFVKETTGVDNVCERSALYKNKKGKLIVKKTAKNGVTVAICEEKGSVIFE